MRRLQSKMYSYSSRKVMSLRDEYVASIAKKEEKRNYEVELLPSVKQRRKLDTLFAGPELILSLLTESKPKILSKIEASFFLLKYKKIIEPYFSPNNRDGAVDLLSKLILEWSNDLPIEVNLNFSRNCSISDNGSFWFPIEGMALLPPKNIKQLRDVIDRRRYTKNFSILKSGGNYFATIQTIVAVDKAGGIENVSKKSKADLFYEDYMKAFDVVTNKSIQDGLRLSRGYAKPDFNAVEGREVQGGLPSLGKRR